MASKEAMAAARRFEKVTETMEDFEKRLGRFADEFAAPLRAEVKALRAERDDLLKQRGILETELMAARDREFTEKHEQVKADIEKVRKSLDY